MPCRTLGVLVALLVPVGVLVPGASAAPPSSGPTPTLVIEGRGFGHGVGMPQDGALALASSGSSAAAILNRFYPGTAVARRTATVRVGVYDAPGPVVVALPGGGQVLDAPSGPQSPGFPVTVNPGGTVSLAVTGGKYKVTPLSAAGITRPATPPTTAAGAAPTAAVNPAAPPSTPPTTSILDPLLQVLLPTTTVAPTTVPAATPAAASAAAAAANVALTARGLWVVPTGASLVALPQPGRTYRGTLIGAAGGSGLQLTNELDVEQYLAGLGEMPASWPAAALQAQMIAARTYAIRAASAGRTLCDDQQCQVYIGAGNEAPGTTAAVAATRGQVLTYQGSLAETVYSASAGGISATAEEGFGPDSPDLPYLQPVSYPAADPQLWTATIPLADLGARFGYPGALLDVHVSRTGPSGRALEITFDGAKGRMAVDAHRFWDVLQLRSTLYTLRVETGADPAVGEPLGVGVGGSDGSSTIRLRPARGVLGVAPEESLGRAPWVGLAVLLLAVWATAARRIAAPARSTATAAPAPIAPTEPAGEPDSRGQPIDEGPPDDPGPAPLEETEA